MSKVTVNLSTLRVQDNAQETAKNVGNFLKEKVQPLTAGDSELNRIIENLDAVDEDSSIDEVEDTIIDIEVWCEANNIEFID